MPSRISGGSHILVDQAAQDRFDEDLTPYDPTAAFVCDQPSAEIINFYRDQCASSDAVLAVTPLSARPRGRHGVPGQDEPPDVRWVVLHMIEETRATCRSPGHRPGTPRRPDRARAPLTGLMPSLLQAR